MRRLFAIAFVLTLLPGATASAKEKVVLPPPVSVRYGPMERETLVWRERGPIALLVLHEHGQQLKATESAAQGLQGDGFTTFNTDWQPWEAEGPWESEVGQIEEAVRFIRERASELRIDPEEIEIIGGSRGANLALLAGERMDAAAAPPEQPIKAIVALSGDANPVNQVERAQKGELITGIAHKLASDYECGKSVEDCDLGTPELPGSPYMREWSPIVKASATAPAMFLAASVAERRTASLEDEKELGALLSEGFGVPTEVAEPAKGHGFKYWSAHSEPPPTVHERGVKFLVAHADG